MLFAEQLEGTPYPKGSVRERLEAKFRGRMREELGLRKAVSYVGNRGVPFLRLYRYKEAFSFNLVREFLSRFGADREDYVLDPFAGLGTTLFTSMLLGIPSIGIDRLPIAHFIAKTLPKFLFLRENEIKNLWNEIKPKVQKSEPAEVAMDVPIMRLAFTEENLTLLRRLKTAVDGLPQPYRDIFLFLFFSILEECSLTSKDGQFLRLRRDKITPSPLDAMDRKVAMVEEDLRRIRSLYPGLSIKGEVLPEVYLADARDLSGINFRRRPTIIITSPPYANRYDYTRTYSLELCFHFVNNFEELKALRFSILRSHIEAKVGKEERPPHPAVEEVVDALSEKKLNNPKIPVMLIGYFVDMRKVIGEWYRVLAPGGKVAMVVDNVRFEGEMVPVDLILSEMAEEFGFKVREIIVARYKGNSSQQMRKYGKVPVRESITVWEKEG